MTPRVTRPKPLPAITLAVSFLASGVGCAVGGDATDGGTTVPGFDATSSLEASSEGGPGQDATSIFPPGSDGSSGSDVTLGQGDTGSDDSSGADDSGDDQGDDSGDDTGGGDDSSPPADAGVDTGAHDASQDAAMPDAGTPDAAMVDAGPCALTHLVLSQVQSRGLGGGNDEFIDLWNPTAAAVTLDTTWVVDARSNTGSSFTSRWKGTGGSIPAYGHYLITGSAYAGAAAADATLSSGVTDASAVRLTHGGAVVDELCYAYSTSTSNALAASGYACPGTPATNPHNDSSSTDTDTSLERAPGGASGNCTDTGSSATDFKKDNPSAPENTTSTPTP